MKKPTLIIVCLFAMQLLSAQTIFSYGKYQVSKDEFLSAFRKNNSTGNNSAALNDYLNLYINFKLKVQAARDMKLDTAGGYRTDIMNFRQQVMDNYLSEDSMIQLLSREAFYRSQKDIRVGHIFVPFDNSNPFNEKASYNATDLEDTLAAFKTITEAYKALQQSTAFTAVALQYSLDPTVKTNQGDIGFVAAFTLPYPIESIVYHLKPGAYSAPYKSRVGYHIFTNIEERPAYGKIKAAQILLPYSPGITTDEKNALRKRADSIYSILKKGGPWETQAEVYAASHQAPGTVTGAIPDVSIGKYDPAFEKAVWSIKADGDITPPFETAYGIHIVKRLLAIKPAADTSQAVTLFRTAVIEDGRVDFERKQQIDQIIRKAGYKKTFSNDALTWQTTDSLLQNANYNYLPAKGIKSNTVLFSFAKEQVTFNDWWTHIQTIRSNYKVGTALPYPIIMQNFISAHAMMYYQNHLEDFNTTFRNQLNEFAEGSLLFDVMEKSVWGKAAKDESALVKFYNKNKSRYLWTASVTAIYFTAENQRVADRIHKEQDSFVNEWRSLAETTSGKIIADSARFELSQLPGITTDAPLHQLLELKTGTTDDVINLVYITSKIPTTQQKTFEEARGLVINDYQNLLEEKWLKTLRKKYRVKVNEKVLEEMH